MLEAGRRDLARLRGSAEAWHELRYEPGRDSAGQEVDANARPRARVLWALQYDRRPEDLPLVRLLAEQEALCRRHAPFQGLGEETELAGFLLAGYRQLDDVWLQWQIKRANFDTWCGYDLEHLFAAGVSATLALVHDSQHPERDAVLERLLDDQGRPSVSEEELASWWRGRPSRFPSDPAEEDTLTWVGRALKAGERELARRYLDRWTTGRPRDQETLGQLRYTLAELGAYADAARAQRESIAFARTDWEKASAWQGLAALERQARDYPAAWQALGECRQFLGAVPGWQEVGLGRMHVHELFLLAGAAPADLAPAVFAEAHRRAGEVPRLPLVALQAAVEAAERVGDRAAADRYRDLRDSEQRRIDA
jgi:hypothetical protein